VTDVNAPKPDEVLGPPPSDVGPSLGALYMELLIRRGVYELMTERHPVKAADLILASRRLDELRKEESTAWSPIRAYSDLHDILSILQEIMPDELWRTFNEKLAGRQDPTDPMISTQAASRIPYPGRTDPPLEEAPNDAK
jgi:hypothetical protein